MARYPIRRSFWYKGYVYLCSILPDRPESAWSVHKCEQEALGTNKTQQYREMFQQQHDIQMDGFLAESDQKLQEAGILVDDKTDLSKEIIKSRQ